uniref:Reverse transcriptase domain-containing protein n=1 Tax=Strigamia maritima TaxID=126957 RepID=T1IMI7_STRMM
MTFGICPGILKRNRTVLIPKTGKDTARAENWRPITIGPLVLRLLTGIIRRKLSNVVPLHESQKGFVDEPGCSVNVFLLNEALEAAKKSGKLAGVLIDVSKAFDTVPHSLLRKTLKAHRVLEALTRSKTWFMKDPEVSLGEVKIPSTDAGKVVRYLSIDVSIWSRAPGGDINKKTLEFVQALGRARLKPSQKVVLLKGYVLPKLFYELQMGFPRAKTLNGLDLIIREEVKSWLKLPATTSDAFFYKLNEDGGLGLPRPRTNIPAAILRRGTAILNCKDRRVQAIVLSSQSMRSWADMAAQNGYAWPTDKNKIGSTKWVKVKREAKTWSRQAYHGTGIVARKRDRHGNWWLKRSDSLRPGDFIAAVQLLTRTFPAKLTLSLAGRPRMCTTCRRCRTECESIGHILGSCPSTKPQRIARHDTIRDALGKAAIKAGLSVAKEQSVGVGDDRLRPDLIIVDGTKSFIVDITVRYEWGLSLADADREKTEKYDRLRLAVDLLFSGTSCAGVLPIVVGSLGTIPMTTVRNLRLLGLCSNKILGFFSRVALNRSIWMASDFMDEGGGVRERTGYARCGF